VLSNYALQQIQSAGLIPSAITQVIVDANDGAVIRSTRSRRSMQPINRT